MTTTRALLSRMALALQVGSAAVLGAEAVQEWIEARTSASLVEGLACIALACGIAFTLRDLARARAMAEDKARALAATALRQVIETRFRGWRLTLSERDIAWSMLRGLDEAAIVRMRGAAQGTVRAQLARIYGKSGVTSRAQFSALFLGQLMALLPHRADQPPMDDETHDL